MRSLEELLRLKKNLRVIGFDDAPFNKEKDVPVNIAGVICSNTRFEGLLWGEVIRDGMDANEVLVKLLKGSKFYEQVNAVFIDGIAFGGFNIIDLPRLSDDLNRPCIAVMRQYPDMLAIDKALMNLADYSQRKQHLINAGKIYHYHTGYYQVSGCDPSTAAQVFEQVTDRGYVPEALRLAHLIGAAIMTGESSNRA